MGGRNEVEVSKQGSGGVEERVWRNEVGKTGEGGGLGWWE